ncbi:hypothetical protein LX36DRAFT_660946 [Colletotrichum falcatum]|nr:hypothetical protein LX36DRAFT_660946 [Colletotrichum falcatum]
MLLPPHQITASSLLPSLPLSLKTKPPFPPFSITLPPPLAVLPPGKPHQDTVPIMGEPPLPS